VRQVKFDSRVEVVDIASNIQLIVNGSVK